MKKQPTKQYSRLDICEMYDSGVHITTIAELTGRTVKSLRRLLEEMGGTDEDFGTVDVSGEKCQCGLRLPCNDCMSGDVTDYLQSRDPHYPTIR